jgi:hypothetical protein
MSSFPMGKQQERTVSRVVSEIESWTTTLRKREVELEQAETSVTAAREQVGQLHQELADLMGLSSPLRRKGPSKVGHARGVSAAVNKSVRVGETVTVTEARNRVLSLLGNDSRAARNGVAAILGSSRKYQRVDRATYKRIA